MSLLISRWYAFVTLLCLIAPISTSLLNVVPGLMLIWLVYFAFKVGEGRRKRNDSASLLRQIDYKFEIIIVVITICCSIYAVNFYTGQILSSVIQAVTSKTGLYAAYQQHFIDNSIGILSIRKVPAIISLLLVKVSLLYIYIKNIAIAESRNRWSWSIVSLTSLAYIYLSVSRGTSFELFEIALLFLFCTIYRGMIVRQSYKQSVVSYLPVAIIIVIFVLIFSYNIDIRYSFNNYLGCVTGVICYDEGALVARYFPGIGSLVFQLSGYFVSGIVYTSYLIVHYWLSGIHEFVQLILPLSNVGGDLYLRHLCDAAFDCGATWSPGIEIFIYVFGFPLVMPVFYLFGRLFRRLTISALATSSFVDIALLYLFTLFMISLPVGHFVETSSSNYLSLLIFLLIWMIKQYDKTVFKRIR